MNMKRFFLILGYAFCALWIVGASTHIILEMSEQESLNEAIEQIKRGKTEDVARAYAIFKRIPLDTVLYVLQELQQEPERDPRKRLRIALQKVLDWQLRSIAIPALKKVVQFNPTETHHQALSEFLEEYADRVGVSSEKLSPLESALDKVLAWEVRTNALPMLTSLIEHNITEKERQALLAFLENREGSRPYHLDEPETIKKLKRLLYFPAVEFSGGELEVLKNYRQYLERLKLNHAEKKVLKKLAKEWQNSDLPSRKSLSSKLAKFVSGSEITLSEEDRAEIAGLLEGRLPEPTHPALSEIEKSTRDKLAELAGRHTVKLSFRDIRILEIYISYFTKRKPGFFERLALKNLARQWRNSSDPLRKELSAEFFTFLKTQKIKLNDNQKKLISEYISELDKRYEHGQALLAKLLADMCREIVRSNTRIPNVTVGDISRLLRTEDSTVRSYVGEALVALGERSLKWLISAVKHEKVSESLAAETPKKTKEEHLAELIELNDLRRKESAKLLAKLAEKLRDDAVQVGLNSATGIKLRKQLRLISSTLESYLGDPVVSAEASRALSAVRSLLDSLNSRQRAKL